MAYKLSELRELDIREKEISVLVDTRDYKKVFPKLAILDEIHFYTSSDYLLKEALELAGALREAGVLVSINDFPASREKKLINTKVSLDIGITELGEELTWNLGSNVALGGKSNYMIGKNFPVPDPRTGIVGYLLNKNTAVIFTLSRENEGVGKVFGKYNGEELLIRPTRWFSDLSVISVKKFDGEFISVDLGELFCRPLGSTYIPVTEDELFKILIRFNMRSGGFPEECYRKLRWTV